MSIVPADRWTSEERKAGTRPRTPRPPTPKQPVFSRFTHRTLTPVYFCAKIKNTGTTVHTRKAKDTTTKPTNLPRHGRNPHETTKIEIFVLGAGVDKSRSMGTHPALAFNARFPAFVRVPRFGIHLAPLPAGPVWVGSGRRRPRLNPGERGGVSPMPLTLRIFPPPPTIGMIFAPG